MKRWERNHIKFLENLKTELEIKRKEEKEKAPNNTVRAVEQ